MLCIYYGVFNSGEGQRIVRPWESGPARHVVLVNNDDGQVVPVVDQNGQAAASGNQNGQAAPSNNQNGLRIVRPWESGPAREVVLVNNQDRQVADVVNQNGQAAPSDNQSRQALPSDNQNLQAVTSDNRNRQAAPSDNQNGQAAPSDNYNGQAAPSDNYNGQAAPSDNQDRNTAPVNNPNEQAAPSNYGQGAPVDQDGQVLQAHLDLLNLFHGMPKPTEMSRIWVDSLQAGYLTHMDEFDRTIFERPARCQTKLAYIAHIQNILENHHRSWLPIQGHQTQTLDIGRPVAYQGSVNTSGFTAAMPVTSAMPPVLPFPPAMPGTSAVYPAQMPLFPPPLPGTNMDRSTDAPLHTSVIGQPAQLVAPETSSAQPKVTAYGSGPIHTPQREESVPVVMPGTSSSDAFGLGSVHPSSLNAPPQKASKSRSTPPTGNHHHFMSTESKAILEEWYTTNKDTPYADDATAKELSQRCGEPVSRVKKWLSNKRNSDKNTKGFVGRRKRNDYGKPYDKK